MRSTVQPAVRKRTTLGKAARLHYVAGRQNATPARKVDLTTMTLPEISGWTPDEAAAIAGFRIVAQALPGIVWTAHTGGTPDWLDEDFYRYTGLTEREAAATGWIGCVHPNQRPEIAAKFAHCLATGTALESAGLLRGADGSYRWFSLRARALRNAAGTIIAWLGTLADIDKSQTTIEVNAHVIDSLMQGYLSRPLPVVEGVAFSRHYQPANALERLGGDWYDVFELPDGRIGFSLGDACGHGIEAAVKMGEAKQAIFVAACLGDPAPLRVLERANEVLFLNNHLVSITTAVYGILDTTRRTVTYASAGHHPPILVRANGQPAVLPNHGFPLGVELQMPPRIQTHEFEYESGSTFILYTDGLIEFSHDPADGEARLLHAAAESVRRKAKHPATFIASHVLRGTRAQDDVAVLTMSFQP